SVRDAYGTDFDVW
nr:immunoglobulin heavy chain junction region [Macaca mulatta]